MKQSYGKIIWLTGLSGSGKSTLASQLQVKLESRGVPVVLLDGDKLRLGLNRDLGFSASDREENIRRAGETALLLAEAGHTVLAAFITPLEKLRKSLRAIFPEGRYVEIFLNCPLGTCEARDPKGLYARARRGEIPEFTGISSPFETPQMPDFVAHTGEQTIEETLLSIENFLEERFPDLREPRPSVRLTPKMRRRLVILGLDCAPSRLIFGEEGRNLPTLRNLIAHGAWGPLRSTDPPITLPAWTSMTTGKDPGELGIYGFRNRMSHGYEEMAVLDSTHVCAPRIWDYLEEADKSSILIGIPQTFPPKPHNGVTIADFRDSGGSSRFIYPPELAEELDELAGGEYLADVSHFRTYDKDRLSADLYTMVQRRFRVASELLVREPWDFFMMVEMATDRLHHGFWRYWARDHRLYAPGNPYERVIPDFYRYLDSCIGSLLGLLNDRTTVMVVSDHGARSMVGGVRINEWLIRNGYLRLLCETDAIVPLSWKMIDWSRTVAWSEGGYYARVFLNVRGREPRGVIEPEHYETVRDELAQRIMAMPDDTGRPMHTVVLKPEDTYRARKHVPPDLIVYLDGLSRRSIGTVGPGDIFCYGNDTGPDDANHDHDGVFIMARMSDVRSGRRRGVRVEDASCLDVTPTALHELGLTVPDGVGGSIITIDSTEAGAVSRHSRQVRLRDRSSPREASLGTGFTPEEAEIVQKRLADLGYI